MFAYFFFWQNAKPLPILSSQEKVIKASELRVQFPVSSGSQHRAKDPDWVPVEKNAPVVASGASVKDDKVFEEPPSAVSELLQAKQ